mgnify:CR=1 FL=1
MENDDLLNLYLVRLTDGPKDNVVRVYAKDVEDAGQLSGLIGALSVECVADSVPGVKEGIMKPKRKVRVGLKDSWKINF